MDKRAHTHVSPAAFSHAQLGGVFIAALALALCLTRLYSYVLFHSVVELFTVAVAWSLFFLAWNARRAMDNHYVLLVGIAWLFAGCLSLAHTLAYKGMGVFPGPGTNRATQLWIATQIVHSAALLAAPLFIRRRLNTAAAMGVSAAAAAGLGLSIFAGAFPTCYVEGAGLTRFKIAAEWAIAAVLLSALVLLVRRRADFDRSVFRGIACAIALWTASEIVFTGYVDVYGLANMAGHLLRFIAFCLLYRAILVTGIERPFDLLYRNLARSEDDLRHLNEQLVLRIDDARRAASERERLIGELKDALAEVKTLSGLLPICAHCKKIRDDRGYWTQVESYIHARTGASFSHGICPECACAFFPEYPGSGRTAQETE